MLFNSYEFILPFMGGLLFVYWLASNERVPGWSRKALLILASAIFIFNGGLISLGLLGLSLAVNYGFLWKIQIEKGQRQ